MPKYFCIALSFHAHYLVPKWAYNKPPSLPSAYVQAFFVRLSITYSFRQQP